jgi:hypothetical protein
MTTETWRVVAEGGEAHDVVVRPRVELGSDHPERRTEPTPPRVLVIEWARRRGLAIVEIRGPGELTTAEQVAAMRERCETAARDVATRAKALALHHGAQWNADGAVHAAAESTGATHAARSIRALPLEVPRG